MLFSEIPEPLFFTSVIFPKRVVRMLLRSWMCSSTKVRRLLSSSRSEIPTSESSGFSTITAPVTSPTPSRSGKKRILRGTGSFPSLLRRYSPAPSTLFAMALSRGCSWNVSPQSPERGAFSTSLKPKACSSSRKSRLWAFLLRYSILPEASTTTMGKAKASA